MAPKALLHVSLTIFFLSTFVNGGGNFIVPPEATDTQIDFPVYQVGDILPISWNDTFDLVTLIVNQLKSPVTQIDYLPDSST
jgi:hypothetical protein